jgi:sulfur-oxidizing protein SoxB
MDVDLKLASRVTGIDVILGGHTHDAVPQPIAVAMRARHARHQCRLERQVSGRARSRTRQGKVANVRYRLLPVFSNS